MALKLLNPDGTTNHIDEQVLLIVETLAKLKLIPPVANATWTTTGTPALLLGNAAAFDQSLKLYAWDPALTTAGNDTSIVQPTAITGSNPGRWRAP